MNSLHRITPDGEQKKIHCLYHDLDAIVDDFERNLQIANQELRDVIEYASSIFANSQDDTEDRCNDEDSISTFDCSSTISSLVSSPDRNADMDGLVVCVDSNFAIEISKVLDGDCDVVMSEDGESMITVESMARALKTLMTERKEFIAESLELMKVTKRLGQYKSEDIGFVEQE